MKCTILHIISTVIHLFQLKAPYFVLNFIQGMFLSPQVRINGLGSNDNHDDFHSSRLY